MMRKFCCLALVCISVLLNGTTAGADDGSRLDFEFRQNEKVAFVGGSLAERMNLFGNFETMLHSSFPDQKLMVRNFGWPADEVSNQQRPSNYSKIDHPLEEFGPELFICFFGFNEHFSGDNEPQIEKFITGYKAWIKQHREKYSKADRPARFVIVSPIPFEKHPDPHLPDAEKFNPALKRYCEATKQVAEELNLPYVDLFSTLFDLWGDKPEQMELTVNGIHVNAEGDMLVARELAKQLIGEKRVNVGDNYEQLKKAVNDKSWFHLQDYRMLNGWYVYGGRRTWDKKTFPNEYQKIRKMVAVRDQYIWDIAAGKKVADQPDDSQTGEVFIPETMFGTRDDNFRKNREPKTLQYPTPEESIKQMSVPEGMEVQLFASEREFPEFANPTNIAFDNKGRLWASCMINYPQWLPGSAKPGDKLLIFEDTDNDGKADKCITFYDKLICPTGFEFHKDGVLVVDEPRILFLRDTDGDDRADEVTQVIDGIGTDDTHHAMGAWEWSHGGSLYMLEGIKLSTTLETPWGPFRVKGPSGAYVMDPKSWKFRYFKTPGYGNPWCLVFDRWGMEMIGDGTNSRQHWGSPLSGYNVGPRKTLRANFDNENMRPSVGSEFLYSRHLPDEVQGHFTYACVINMHGMPRFEYGDDGTAGYSGKRIKDLIRSTDNFFRPVDPKIGPDGAVWFGDWCNALIGHMQYSQRDPNRDHEHGRVYRLVNKNKPLIKPELQAGADIGALLEQLTSYELRTRYRARRELHGREKAAVLDAAKAWIASPETSDEILCEALWLQESFGELDPALIQRLMARDDFHSRSAAVHAVTNEIGRYDDALSLYKIAIKDSHPRVRLEALRGLSFVQSLEAAEVAMQVIEQSMDYWLEYTLEHTLHALKPFVKDADALANSSKDAKAYFAEFLASTGPGGQAVRPLRKAQNSELPKWQREQAVASLAKLKGGKKSSGRVIYQRICSSCHMVGDEGKKFGPALDGLAGKYNRQQIIKHILWPNEEIAKGFETVQVLLLDGRNLSGFVIEETDSTMSLGVATDDGKGKRIDIDKEEIDVQKAMKASSMPEGLVATIAPSEFLDLVEFLGNLYTDDDNWVATGRADQGELRKHGQFEEISRDAKIRIRPDFPRIWNKNVNLTLSAAGVGKREFAFHSPQPAIANPHVEIKLAAEAEVRHIKLLNRRNKGFYSRAAGLTVWTSMDGKDWQRVWKAKEPAAQYEVDLPAGTKAQYLKVGLDKKGIFHLNQIVVFGKK